MAKTVVIFDLNFMTYTYHSTPQASMYAMLISGWHKSRGDRVIFTDEPPNYGLYDIVYIIKDRIGVGHVNSWLAQDNVVPVGDYWAEDGIDAFYNEEWETTPPDNTIYWGWLDRWTTRYKKYNKARLEHFYRTPVKIKQRNKFVWPKGRDFLILDKDMHEWDPDFEQFIEQDIQASRFAYPIPIDGRWREVLSFLTSRQISREYLFIDMFYENYTDEDFEEASDIWAEFMLGRMVRLHLNVDLKTNEEWIEAIPRIYNALGMFRMKAKKMVRVQPFHMDRFSHPRIIQELKRWTGRSVGYAKNSLFDYILFDSIRNTEWMKDFLRDPYQYTEDRRHGTNKLKEVISFAEEYPDLLYCIAKSYPKAGA